MKRRLRAWLMMVAQAGGCGSHLLLSEWPVFISHLTRWVFLLVHSRPGVCVRTRGVPSGSGVPAASGRLAGEEGGDP